MITTLDERKIRYMETVETAYLPPEKTWWQYPPPAYHHTKSYAGHYDKAINTEVPVIIKRARKEWMIAVLLIIVALLSLYLVAKNEFGFLPILFLILLLIAVLPRLLENKALIRISDESVWFYNQDKEIPWQHVLLTYIKVVQEETLSYFFIIHYYDDKLDEFDQFEMELRDLISPAMFAAMIEKFRQG